MGKMSKFLALGAVVGGLAFAASAIDVIVTPVPKSGHGSHADSEVSAVPLFAAGGAADSDPSPFLSSFLSSADSGLLPFFCSDRVGFLLFLR